MPRTSTVRSLYPGDGLHSAILPAEASAKRVPSVNCRAQTLASPHPPPHPPSSAHSRLQCPDPRQWPRFEHEPRQEHPMPITPSRRLPRPPDAGDRRPRLHERPQLLRPLLLRRLHARRQAVPARRDRPLPEHRRDGRVRHDRRSTARRSTSSARRATLAFDRMDTKVGPIGVEVVEPLRRSRIFAEPNDIGAAVRPALRRRDGAVRGAALPPHIGQPRASWTTRA